MDIKKQSQNNLPPIYSEDYQQVPIYDDGFHQPTAPASDQHVVITQQPQQVIIQSKYYFYQYFVC